MKEIKPNAAQRTHNVVGELLLQEKNCKTVLDIPSGEGFFSTLLKDKGITIYSADCENLFRVEGAHFNIVDMNRALPYDDGQFDAVVSIDGIEHIENPFNFVRECNRILRSGGILIISTPNISSFRSRWRWLWTGFHNKNKTPLDETNPNPLHHINMMSFPRLRYILHSNGFRISKTATNKVKLISLIYFLFAPFSFLITFFVFLREEKKLEQRKRNRQILKQMFLRAVMFGETLIVKAVKKSTRETI